MTTPHHEQLRQLIRTIRAAIADRTAAEKELATVHLEKAQAAEETWKGLQVDIQQRRDSEFGSAEANYKERKNKYAGSTHAEFEGLRNSLAQAQKEMEGRHYLETEGLKRAFDDAVWSTKTIYDGDKMSTNEALRVKEHEARTACQKLEGMLEQAETMLGEWGLPTHYAELPKVDPVKVPEGASPKALLEEYLKKGEKQFNNIKSLSLPKLLKWIYVIPLGILLAIALFVIVWKASGSMVLGVTGIPAAAVIAFAIIYSGKQVASWQARKATEPLGDLVAEALTLEPHCKREADVETKRELKRLQDQKNTDLAAHEAKFVPEIKQQKITFEAEAKAFFTSKDAQLANMQARVKTEIEKIETDYSALKQSLETRFTTELTTAEANYQRDAVTVRQKYNEAKQGMVGIWRSALATIQSEAKRLNSEVDQISPSWESWKALPTPATMPDVIRLGTYTIDFNQIAGGMPIDEELKAELPEKFTLPALAPFPTGGNVLLKADGPGKEQAVDALQALTLRFLTQLPAGKARLTMFDPVGLGDNFAALMHLADYDEALIAHRIWTEEHHFETRLVDLTGHMESIIQKYLRNQYQSIEAYNEDAGEVAEPFRLLVVANYPANFNTEAAKRLMSVAASGARCGVSTFISMDVAANQPRDINQSLLEENSLVLEYRDGSFHLTDPDYAGLPLTLATPPDDKKTTELLNKVGQAAKDAAKVEVAFKLVHPQHDQKPLWYADSANGINIPLGRVRCHSSPIAGTGAGDLAARPRCR